MSTYIIGDIHGCYDELKELLKIIKYNPALDTLKFTGDLINGGPKSIEVLQFIMELDSTICVLGNHDLTLLAMYSGAIKSKDDFSQILESTYIDSIVTWLKQCPLINYDPEFNVTLVHAAIDANWDLQKAQQLAAEVTTIIKSNNSLEFFHNMFGNTPNFWDDNLTGTKRLRTIINIFTRTRYNTLNGQYDFNFKNTPEKAPDNLIPWFKLQNRKTINDTIIFGHWSSLNGITNNNKIIALDTGCVWGGSLSAYRLEDKKIFNVKSKGYKAK